MKSATNSTTASAMFVNGPAAITTTFFQARWRQYASGASAQSSSCSCLFSRRCGESSETAAGAAVGLDELLQVTGRRAVDACEHLLHRGGDVEEADAAVEERLHRDFVGGVVGARIGAAPLPRLAPELEQPEGVGVRLVELER